MDGIIIYFLAVATVGTLVLALHLLGNKTLNKSERLGFAAGAALLILTNIVEISSYSMTLAIHYQGIFTLLMILESILPPLTIPAECYACGQKKMGRIAAIACCVYLVVLIAVSAAGQLFYLNAQGEYGDHYNAVLGTVFTILDTIYLIVMLHQVSKSYANQDRHTLVGIIVLTVAVLFFTPVSGDSGLTLVGGDISFMLMYVYYSSLKQYELQNQMKKITMETIQSVVSALDAKDDYTNGHSQRVAEYSCMLAKRLGYDERQLELLRYAAELHDVGKIAIPDSVLNKAGRLGNVEFGMMKEHTVKGSEIAKKITMLPNAYNAARSHHERYDGKGYPDGKAGEDIPEIARIIAIADTFDAMNSDRIYRKALPKDVIRSEMCKGSGTQFDPVFVQEFVKMMDSGELDSVAQSGRADMLPERQESDFARIARDVLEFFTVRYDYTGEWDEEFDKWDRLKDYIGKVTRESGSGVKFCIVVISIWAAENREVSDWQAEESISVMKSAVTKIMNREDICGKISKHQLAIVVRKEENWDPKELDGTIKEIFLYFYKIFESEPFKIDYKVVD